MINPECKPCAKGEYAYRKEECISGEDIERGGIYRALFLLENNATAASIVQILRRCVHEDRPTIIQFQLLDYDTHPDSPVSNDVSAEFKDGLLVPHFAQFSINGQAITEGVLTEYKDPLWKEMDALNSTSSSLN